MGGFDRLHEEFGRAFAGGGIVIRNEARIVEVSLHKTEVFLLFVTVAPVNRDPLLAQVLELPRFAGLASEGLFSAESL